MNNQKYFKNSFRIFKFNKRGQFYIIAAIIIVVAIASLIGVATYAIIKPDSETFKSLSLDLKKEGPKIIDHGIFNNKNLTELMDNFTQNEFAPYFLKKTNNANVVFIYGNKTNLNAVQYNLTSTGAIYSTIGRGMFQWNSVNAYAERLKITINPGDENIEVSVLDKNYNFKLKEGEMFYFLMVEEKEGERYVERN